MKIIVSPTKSMKRKDYNIKSKEVLFKEKSDKLRDILKTYDYNQLKKLYKSSDKIIDATMTYYKDEKESIEALNLYDGLVFKQIKLESYQKDDMDYLNDHLIILSGLYGALYPGSLIKEYRLDYLMKFEVNLYEYWSDSLQELFKDEDLIVNLASSEFSDSIVHPNIVNIHFVDHTMSVKSTAAKMARGNMLNYLVVKKVETLSDVLKFKELDYVYKEDLSDSNNIYFMQEE